MRSVSILLSILLLCACGGASGSADGAKAIHIAMLKGPSAMGMIRMIDSVATATSASASTSSYAATPTSAASDPSTVPRLSIEIYNEPTLVRKAILDGTADFAALPMNMAAVLYNKGLPYTLAAVPVSGSLYLAGSDSTIRTWSDLRGRKINIMAKGMTPDILLRHLLMQNGLTPDEDVTLNYNFPTHTDMASALASGRAPLGVISEPYLSVVMKNNTTVRPLIDLNKEWAAIHGFSITETAFLVSTRLANERPELLETVLRSYESSISWVNAHPDSAALLMVRQQIISDTAAARTSIPQSHLTFRRAKEHKNEIDAYLRTLLEISPELVGGKLPDEAFYQ